MWWLTIVIVVLISLYVYLNNKTKYWQNLRVKCAKPMLFIGNFGPLLSGKQNLGQLYTSIYREFKDAKYVGFYKMNKPGLIICDASLTKDILMKDYEYFAKNDIDVNEELDPLFAKNPFVLVGEKWKHTRSLVTPAFTSGKMKMMFPLIEETIKSMTKYIDSNVGNALDAKELSAHFTTDNVATCAFGLEAKSFENAKSEFREMGRKIFNLSVITNIKMSIGFLEPTLAKWLRIRLIPKEPNDYFTAMVSENLKYRVQNNIIRNDFLDMMQQVKIKVGPSFTDIDVAAHAIGFFVDGFETSATTMSFVLYCIAKHPDVQTKLRDNINDAIENTGGKFTYEAVQEMDYLDMVINETLRMYPAVFMLLKMCTKAYDLPPQDGIDLTVQPGTPVVIPMYGYHTDGKYFPNPEEFDPERFSEVNKPNIEKGSFLPFGDGPRACLGQRFGLLQVKLGVVAVVRNFSISVNKKTIEPIQIDPKSFLMAASGGMWIDFKKI